MIRSVVLRAAPVLAAIAVLASGAAAQECPAMGKGPMPYKYVGPATKAAISPCDLMTRLYIYADDSLMGRDIGTEYHMKATAYIESEVRKLGLKPGGDAGGYFQNIHVIVRAFDTTSMLMADGTMYKAGTDFYASTPNATRQLKDVKVIAWGGTVFDTLNTPKPEDVAGKLLYVRPALAQPAGFDAAAFIKTQGYQNYLKAVAASAGSLGSAGDSIPLARLNAVLNPTDRSIMLESDQPGRVTITVTNKVLDALLGAPAATVAPGTIGKTVTADLRFKDSSRPGRNVVAILPGSDPKLKGEYVAIGGHNDHVGFSPISGQCGRTVASDSQHVWNAYGRPAGAEGGRNLQQNPISAEEWAAINTKIADLRKAIPERADSICNGADDDGTGSVSVLEMAEAFAKGNVKPKRSILFVWHAGEEHGMWGSGYFMDHPTVPRDSVVAQLNIDMVGRGAASDVTGQAKATIPGQPGAELHGGDKYLQLVGSRRLSTELGDLVETVNKEKGYNFNFDYNIDADGHQQNIYCRSDHWSYAKWGVPVVFFTTGGHADYHQVTDEPQYIRYQHMAMVDNLIFDIAVKVANLDHRVVVDHPKPNPVPATTCKQ